MLRLEHLIKQFLKDEGDGLCLFIFQEFRPGHLAMVVNDCQDKIVGGVIFLQSIRYGNEIALQSVQGILLIQYDRRHLSDRLPNLGLLEIANLTGFDVIYHVFLGEWQPIPPTDLLKTGIFCAVE